MLTLYTPDELSEQIWAVEHVRVRFPKKDAEGRLSDVYYKQRYEEMFPTPLSDEATVAEVQLRVTTFTAINQVTVFMLPPEGCEETD